MALPSAPLSKCRQNVAPNCMLPVMSRIHSSHCARVEMIGVTANDYAAQLIVPAPSRPAATPLGDTRRACRRASSPCGIRARAAVRLDNKRPTNGRHMTITASMAVRSRARARAHRSSGAHPKSGEDGGGQVDRHTGWRRNGATSVGRVPRDVLVHGAIVAQRVPVQQVDNEA